MITTVSLVNLRHVQFLINLSHHKKSELWEILFILSSDSEDQEWMDYPLPEQ